MRRFFYLSAAVIIGSLFYSGYGICQGGGAVPVDFYLSHEAFPTGGSGEFAVVFDVPPDYHITSLENGLFFLEFDPPQGFAFDEPVFPQMVDFDGESVFQGRVIVLNSFSIAPDVAPGEYDFRVTYGYQVCTETGSRMCFLPQEAVKNLVITVLPSDITPIPAHPEIFGASRDIDSPREKIIGGKSAKTLEGRFSAAVQRGSLLAFIIVFIAGILTSFTPCVYPVIPITIGYIGGRTEGNRLKGFVLSLFLVLGLATIMSASGIIAAATGQVFGSLTQHPAVIIFVALIFTAMGASMLGAFDLSLPSSWQSRMHTTKRGFLGAYFVGIFTGLVAAPCVGPVLVALLAWVAQSGNLLMGFLLLFVYALGLGMLFVIIGTFAGAITALPGSGAWMDMVKHIFGALLFAGAILILKSLLSPGIYLLLWGTLLIIAGIFSGGLSLVRADEKVSSKWGRGIGVILLVAGIITFVSGFRSTFGFEAHSYATKPAVAESAIEWMVNQPDSGFALAAETGKPVLMDFYADWCAACKELEEKSFSHPEIIANSRDWVFIKMDMTSVSKELKAEQSLRKVHGLPTIILFDSKGREQTRFSGFKPPDYILAMMDEVQ